MNRMRGEVERLKALNQALTEQNDELEKQRLVLLQQVARVSILLFFCPNFFLFKFFYFLFFVNCQMALYIKIAFSLC